MPINLRSKFRILNLTLVMGGMLIVLATASVAVALAAQSPAAEFLGFWQQTETPRPTVTPPPGPITLDSLPACQMYYVSVPQTPVRTCAGSGCQLVQRLPQYEVVCVRGVTDNPDWLTVSLTTEDTSAPVYAIEKARVEPGPLPSEAERYEDCWNFVEVADVVTANVNLRQCPSLDCPVLDTLEPGEWACVYGWSGEYRPGQLASDGEWIEGEYFDWIRVDIPNGLRGVWLSENLMDELQIDTPPTESVVAIAQAGTITPTSIPPSDTPSPTPAAPTEVFQPGSTPGIVVSETPAQTATETVTLTPTPACTSYAIDVAGGAGGNLRTCPSIECSIATTLPDNTALCVLGPSEQAGWLTVDLNPEEPADELVYVSQEIVQPTDTEPPSLIVPTATFTPTQPVCAPGSALAECVTVTPTPVLEPAVPTGVPIGPLLAQEISLAELDVPNLELQSPFGYTAFDIFVPEGWVPADNNVLYLDIDYFETQGVTSTEFGDVELVSSMNVLLDEELIAAVSLDETTLGRQTIAIPLPLSVIGDPTNRDHTVQVEFRADDHCLSRENAQVFVRSNASYFHFEFRESRPVLDLSLYPRPIYTQRFVNQVETAYIVLPDDPSATDYRAAMALATGLGDLTFNDVALELATVSEISNLERTTSNLMLVGQVNEHALIEQYYSEGLFPTSQSGDGEIALDGQTINQDEGIVQIIEHPENENLAVITVTGQSDSALLKAAQSLAGPPALLGISGPVAIITDARQLEFPPVGVTMDTRFTFEQLGYPQITLGGYGVTSREINFFMPVGYELTEDAYIDLVVNYSGVLENSRATIAAVLNDTPIASSYLNQRGQTVRDASGLVEPLHLRARIPADAIETGQNNSLRLIANVEGDWNCYPPDATTGWITVLGESEISIPRRRVANEQSVPMVGWFPSPFNSQMDLRNTWISLPEENTTVVAEHAMRILSRIGNSIDGGEGFMPQVSVGELPRDVDLSQYDFMVFGRNTTNPFLAALNDTLPQPFEDNTDNIVQTLDDVEYRLPPNYEVGLLQTLKSPWNSERVILVISGTGLAGQQNAATALSDFLYGSSQLMGNVVFVSDVSVSTVDTRRFEEAEEIVGALEELQAEQTAEALITPSPTASETAAPVAAAVTATPLPTLTPAGPTATTTPFLTLTPEPTVPTPIPTFVPLSEQDLEPNSLDEPDWFLALVLIVGILVLATLFYSLIQIRRRRQDRAL